MTYFMISVLMCIIKTKINLKKALNLLIIEGLNLLYNILSNIMQRQNKNLVNKVLLQKDVCMNEWKLIYSIQFLIFSHKFLHL